MGPMDPIMVTFIKDEVKCFVFLERGEKGAIRSVQLVLPSGDTIEIDGKIAQQILLGLPKT